MSADLNATSIPSTLPTMFYECNGIFILPAEDLETRLSNEIKIYGDIDAIKAITYLVNEYLSI